eukprot:Platyproteum_vivax@DN7625_c1_g1_i13.p1
MKLFSAVVLSLLFCFVKGFKSRAIRAHLKNVSAHGQAMREQSHGILQKKIERLREDTVLQKKRIEEMNADTGTRDINALSLDIRTSADEAKDLAESRYEFSVDEEEKTQQLEEQTKQLNSLGDTFQKLSEEFLEKKQELDEAAIGELSPQMEILKEKASAAKKEDEVNDIWDQVEAVREEAQRLAGVVERMDESEKKKRTNAASEFLL